MYSILTDSACDISQELLAQWGVKSVNLSFVFDGDTETIANDQIPAREFYRQMREGKTAKTSAINVETFREFFQKELDAGKDVLYLGFSSGLSATYQSACIAAAELREEYPQRFILTVDTLAASAGVGLLVYLVTQEKACGASVVEAAKFAEALRPVLCHWFTVDSLEYLKRGGRVSATTAFLGGALNIKPLMRVDDEGHLVADSKVRGRKAAIREMAKKVTESATDTAKYPIYISHGDCKEDAELLASFIREQCGAEVALIADVGPVIGAHTGPGVLALFFVGMKR